MVFQGLLAELYGAIEGWQGRQAYVVILLYVVSCTSSCPVDAPEQAVFYDCLKSNIKFPPYGVQKIAMIIIHFADVVFCKILPQISIDF